MRLTLLTALVLLLAGCASPEEPPATTSPATTAPGTTSPASPTRSDPFATPPATTTPVASTPRTTTPAPTGTNGTPQLSGTKIIEIRDFVYEPETLVIEAGSRVRVQNEHVLTHTVTSDTGAFDTGSIKQGDPEFTFFMNETGTYPYRCKFHPQMRGNITVVPAQVEPEPAEPTPPPTNELERDAQIFDFDFRPREPTYKVGTSVTWTNVGNRVHTVTANDGSFDSGNIPANGGTFTHVFATAGSYTYRCKIHPSMTASVIVTA